VIEHQPPWDETPVFHPDSHLGVVAGVIDVQLEDAEEHHRLLLTAAPGSLDGAIVSRIVRVFTEEIAFLDLYDGQLARWRRGTLTPAQRREVERLCGQVARNRVVAGAILELTEDLRAPDSYREQRPPCP
jgi:hypothetical protein